MMTLKKARVRARACGPTDIMLHVQERREGARWKLVGAAFGDLWRHSRSVNDAITAGNAARDGWLALGPGWRRGDDIIEVQP